MGGSRGVLTTTIHDLVDAEGRPVRIALTPGQAYGGMAAGGILTDLEPGTTLLADRAYDSDAIREQVREQGVWANILSKRSRKGTFAFSGWVYRQSNLVERFFYRLKQFRGIATRYDKDPDDHFAAIKFASGRICMRHNKAAA